MQCHPIISVYFLIVVHLSGKLVHGGVQVLYPLTSSSTSEKSSHIGHDDDTDDYHDESVESIQDMVRYDPPKTRKTLFPESTKQLDLNMRRLVEELAKSKSMMNKYNNDAKPDSDQDNLEESDIYEKMLSGKLHLDSPDDLDKYIKSIQDMVKYGPPTTRRTLFPELTKQLDINMRQLDEEMAKSKAMMDNYNNKAKPDRDQYNLEDHLSNNYKSYDNDHHYGGINHDSAISHQDNYDRINKWDNYDHKYDNDHNHHYDSSDNDIAISHDSTNKYKRKDRSERSRKILILAVFLPVALLVCLTVIVFRTKDRSRLLSPDRRRHRGRQETPRPCNHPDCCARLPLNVPGCLHAQAPPYNPAMAPLNPHYGTDVMMPQPFVEATPDISAPAPTAPVCDLPPSYNEAIAMAPAYTEQDKPSAPPIEQS